MEATLFRYFPTYYIFSYSAATFVCGSSLFKYLHLNASADVIHSIILQSSGYALIMELVNGRFFFLKMEQKFLFSLE